MLGHCIRSCGFQRCGTRHLLGTTKSVALGVAATRPAPKGVCIQASMAQTSPQTVSSSEDLVYSEDLYGGVIVSVDNLPSDPDVFRRQLQTSLQAWSAAGKRGVWIKIPISKSSLIPVMTAMQSPVFKFHHAEEGYVMLTTWLCPTSPDALPPNASHQVGVGAFVVNENKEVLVVRELRGPLAGKMVWKLPTGLVHAGEDIVQAAEREVLEETGIATKFSSVLTVRQAHGFLFGKSDMFFVCALQPEPGQLQPRPQEQEIVEARWLPLHEYASQDFVKNMPLYAKILDRCISYTEGRYKGLAWAKLESNVVSHRSDLLMFGDD